MSAAVAAAAAGAHLRRQEAEVVIDLLDSDSEDVLSGPQRASSGREAGPSRQQAGPAAHSYGQQHQQRQRRPAGAAPDVVDLTGSRPPAAGDSDLQIVRSTVARGPSRGAKRPRIQPPPQLSPMKQLLLQQLRNPPPPPPPEAEPEGPKCGICMEAMGGGQGAPMASGPCGHVYCHGCLVEAVKAQKKCPTCRKSMQVRQIHKVFVNFS